MDERKPKLVPLAAALVGLAWAASLSGCARDRYYSGLSEGTRTARKPLFAPKEPGRPFFVGGYAGADYNRATRPVPLRNQPMELDR